jgi:hypothetical protein
MTKQDFQAIADAIRENATNDPGYGFDLADMVVDHNALINNLCKYFSTNPQFNESKFREACA